MIDFMLRENRFTQTGLIGLLSCSLVGMIFSLIWMTIKNAPTGWEMDLANIYGFGLFASSLEEEKVIYIDEVRLVE